MSVEILSPSPGLITCKITGKLAHPEFAKAQQTAAKILREQGKARLLVIAENFEGWEKGGAWGDLSFQAQYDPQIERMAIVADKQWEDLAILFAAKGLRQFPIEYFQPADLPAARSWLANSS